MTILILGYQFEGPYTSTASLEDKSGVYVILTSDHKNVIDVGESQGVKSRVEYHERKPCWNRHNGTRVAVYYTDEVSRMSVENLLRRQYNPPCGER